MISEVYQSKGGMLTATRNGQQCMEFGRVWDPHSVEDVLSAFHTLLNIYLWVCSCCRFALPDVPESYHVPMGDSRYQSCGNLEESSLKYPCVEYIRHWQWHRANSHQSGCQHKRVVGNVTARWQTLGSAPMSLYISKMYFSHWKPPGVFERMWSVTLDVSISG